MDIGDMNYDGWLYRQVIIADRARNRTATRENMRVAMEKNGVQYSVVLPVPPFVTFADLRGAADKDPGIIPFTGERKEPHPSTAKSIMPVTWFGFSQRQNLSSLMRVFFFSEMFWSYCPIFRMSGSMYQSSRRDTSES